MCTPHDRHDSTPGSSAKSRQQACDVYPSSESNGRGSQCGASGTTESSVERTESVSSAQISVVFNWGFKFTRLRAPHP